MYSCKRAETFNWCYLLTNIWSHLARYSRQNLILAIKFVDAIDTGGNSGGEPRSSQRDFRVFCCQRGQRFIVGKFKFIGNGLKLIGNKVKFIGKGVKFIGIVGYVIISLQQFQSIRIITFMLNIRSELTQQKSLDGVVAR